MLTASQLEALQAIRASANGMAVRVARINDTIRNERLPIPLVPMPHQLGSLIDSIDWETAKHERAMAVHPLAGMMS